ncbi:MAG: methyltransferase domain-containing protein [Actinomycetota bacterium]|nr:methyltransferase domain-containing protein [Actinomycetota bacterium]
MSERARAKRLIGAIYSGAADKLYDPLIVNGAFKLFGRNLNALVLEQGQAAVAAAGTLPILDMPVGTGYFATEVARRHGGIVVGADIARGMVVEAAQRARRAGLGNLSAVQADAHHLPFPDATFGAVLCSNGLQVMPGLEAAVRELERVLAPGGTLFASVITLPLDVALPARWSDRLPTMFRSGGEVADALNLPAPTIRRERLATLIEARKP